jgi:hypothetical protein
MNRTEQSCHGIVITSLKQTLQASSQGPKISTLDTDTKHKTDIHFQEDDRIGGAANREEKEEEGLVSQKNSKNDGALLVMIREREIERGGAGKKV